MSDAAGSQPPSLRDCRWQLLAQSERADRRQLRERLNYCWDLLQQNAGRTGSGFEKRPGPGSR